MIKLPYSIRYRIGRFRISMDFEHKPFYRDVQGYLDSRFPESRTFKFGGKDRIDCRCYFFTSRQKGKPKKTLRYLRFSGADFFYSGDFKEISVFLNNSEENIKGSIPYLLYFAPFFLKNNAVLEHCSSVIYRGYGFAFIGDPDVGKSTIARILSGGGAQILSDEMALLYSYRGKSFVAPAWLSSSDRKISIRQRNPACLKAIFFLQQGNFILRELGFYDKMKNLYRNYYGFFMPQLKMQEDFYLTACRLFRFADCYQLYYDRSQNIFSLLNNFVV